MKILHVVNVGILANGIGAVILPLQNEQARLGHIVKVATVRYLKEATHRFLKSYRKRVFEINR